MFKGGQIENKKERRVKPRSTFGFFAEEKRSRYLQGITRVDYKDRELLRSS